jgi:DNA repair protein RadC
MTTSDSKIEKITMPDTLPIAEPIHYIGHRHRLRERFLKSKKGSLPDYEVLEILLFSSHQRGDVKPLAKDLIARFGSLAKVLNANPAELLAIKGVNESSVAQMRVVQEAVERLLKDDVDEKPVLQSWKALLDYCRASMGHLTSEQFRILFLNRKNMLISDELQEVGTIDQTPVYPREVVKRALQLEASSIILVHNHPSGDTTPSKADISLTKQIQQAAATIGVIVHDHLIVSSKGHYSFKTNGII